jgi:quercetin dioxygenase-like cupin family protein
MAKKVQKTQTLGEKVRHMREGQNVSLEALAHKTGYAPEYLKEIEDGTVAPPVGALIQITRALSLDSSSLLSEDKRKERVQSYNKRTKAYSYKNLTPDAEDKHLWAYLVTLEPKREHEMVAYQHEGEEFVFVMEGRVEILVGEEKHVIKKGGTLHFNSALKHNLKNLSSTAAKLLVVVYTP